MHQDDRPVGRFHLEPLGSWTQSKVPCSLSEATSVRPKVKILSSSPLSEQGMVMLCNTNQPKESTGLKPATLLTHSTREFTPWLPLKEMVGRVDQP